MKRKPKSTLDLVRPDLTCRVIGKQQKQYHNIHSKQLEFSIGDNVFSLIHSRNSQTWLPATITAITGPLTYVVQLDDGRTQRCHINHIIIVSINKRYILIIRLFVLHLITIQHTLF